MRVVHITGGIPERIGGHIYDRVGKWWVFKTFLIISMWLDPVTVDLGDIGGV